MRLVIFGGTGETGNLLVQKALQQGHEVLVLARNPSRLHYTHGNLRVIRAELNNATAIDDIVKHADAVISVLGPNEMSDRYPISEGMRNIVKAMEKHGVRRLIATTTPSTRDPRDRFSFKFRVNDMLIKAIMPKVWDDSVRAANIITSSKLDWTIIRVPFLTNRPMKKKVVTGYFGDGRINLFFLNRGDLADFLLSQLEDKTFVHQLPALSNQ